MKNHRQGESERDPTLKETVERLKQEALDGIKTQSQSPRSVPIIGIAPKDGMTFEQFEDACVKLFRERGLLEEDEPSSTPSPEDGTPPSSGRRDPEFRQHIERIKQEMLDGIRSQSQPLEPAQPSSQPETLDQGAKAALNRLLTDNPGMTREEALQTLRDLGYI